MPKISDTKKKTPSLLFYVCEPDFFCLACETGGHWCWTSSHCGSDSSLCTLKKENIHILWEMSLFDSILVTFQENDPFNLNYQTFLYKAYITFLIILHTWLYFFMLFINAHFKLFWQIDQLSLFSRAIF